MFGAKYLFSDVHVADAMRVPSAHTIAATSEVELRQPRYALRLNASGGVRWSELVDSWRRHGVGLVGAELQVPIADDKWIALRFSGELVEDDEDTAVSTVNLKWGYDVTGGK